MSRRSGPVVSLPSVIPPLPPGATMALWPLSALVDGADPGPPLYVSGGKWLHPLFDLLEERATLAHAGDLFLRDRVIGRGAAFLILRAGIRNAWADVVSDGAMSLFAAHGASLGGGELVPAIACQTEPLLRDVDDPDIAWTLLRQRRAAGPAH
jgi:hypothetical protein